uniref:DUF663 domain-containing protein n=1 Tax=Steinernema glaseri TaxID=37863 RepID=A0A1I8AU68_9BILA
MTDRPCRKAFRVYKGNLFSLFPSPMYSMHTGNHKGRPINDALKLPHAFLADKWSKPVMGDWLKIQTSSSTSMLVCCGDTSSSSSSSMLVFLRVNELEHEPKRAQFMFGAIFKKRGRNVLVVSIFCRFVPICAPFCLGAYKMKYKVQNEAIRSQ